MTIYQIYIKRKKGKKTRLITFTTEAPKKAYKLQLTPQYAEKVGTYAEVLKRRYDKRTYTREDITSNDTNNDANQPHEIKHKEKEDKATRKYNTIDSGNSIKDFPKLPTVNQGPSQTTTKQLDIMDKQKQTYEKMEGQCTIAGNQLTQPNNGNTMELEIKRMRINNEQILEKFRNEMEIKVEEIL